MTAVQVLSLLRPISIRYSVYFKFYPADFCISGMWHIPYLTYLTVYQFKVTAVRAKCLQPQGDVHCTMDWSVVTAGKSSGMYQCHLLMASRDPHVTKDSAERAYEVYQYFYHTFNRKM